MKDALENVGMMGHRREVPVYNLETQGKIEEEENFLLKYKLR